MKILLIGARGMLGTALQEALKGHQVIPWDRAECDITQPKCVNAITAQKPEWIINAAAYTAVDACETDEAAALAVNATGAAYVAEAAKQLDIPLIHFSTDYVFDGKKQAGYTEDDQPNPINAYGRTKLAGERRLQEILKKFFIVRTSYLYGANGKHIVDTFLNLGKTKSELSILVDQYSRSTYAKDLATEVVRMMDEPAPWGIYHLTNDGTHNWLAFVEKLMALAGLHPVLTPVSMSAFVRPAPRPQYSALLNTKRPPLRPWAEALAEYVRPL